MRPPLRPTPALTISSPAATWARRISYGDITAGGVGTVTSVCDDRLVGFGHPMTFGGKTTLGLMPAEAVYVQADPVGPGFKVANMAPPPAPSTRTA